jgi:hypothetical protein
MKASEVLQESNLEQLTALGQFLIDRANDKNATSKLSVDAFISIASKMGIPLDAESLQDMVMQGELAGVINDVNDEQISFNSEKQVQDNPELSMDKARNTVNNMAQRAMRKRN